MYKSDIYCSGDDELHHWAIQNRKKIGFLGSDIYLAPPEYVIIRKLEFYLEGKSSKHITDIQAMISNSHHLIDMPFLENQIKTRNLEAAWQQINLQ